MNETLDWEYDQRSFATSTGMVSAWRPAVEASKTARTREAFEDALVANEQEIAVLKDALARLNANH